jgi:hypothetical protein
MGKSSEEKVVLKFTFIMSTAVVIATAAHSADRKDPAWPKEPDAFLGIKFRVPVPADFPVCPTDNHGFVDHAAAKYMDGPCVDGRERGEKHRRIHNPPKLGFPYTVSVETVDQVPKYFALDTEQSNFPSLLAALTERYGRPTSSVVKKVKTRAGAEFSAASYRWTGKLVSIALEERADTIDRSMAIISDIELARQSYERREQETKKGAAKL